MKKLLIVLTLTAFTSLLQGAASSNINSKNPSMHTLISNDGQHIEIEPHLALNYLGLFKQLVDLHRLAPQLGSELEGYTTDLSTSAVSGEALRVLIALLKSAETLEDYSLLPSSGLKRTELLQPLIPDDIKIIKQLLYATDFLQINPLITEVILDVAANQFDRQLAEFKDLSISTKNALAKQLFLTHAANSIPEGWKNGENGIEFGVSVQDLIDYNRIPLSNVHEYLHLKDLNINDLTGLNRIPGIEEITRIDLYNNRLTTIDQNAFVGINNNLYSLDLAKNHIQTMDPGAFRNMNNLHFLRIDQNQLQTIPSEAFTGLNNLRSLNIYDNPIHTVAPGAFRNLRGLRGLRLHNNAINDPAEQARIETEVRTASPQIMIFES